MYLSISANSTVSRSSSSLSGSACFFVETEEMGAFFSFFAMGRTGDRSGSSSSEYTFDFVLARARFLGSCLEGSVDLRGFPAFFAAALSLARFSSKYLEINSSAPLHESKASAPSYTNIEETYAASDSRTQLFSAASYPFHFTKNAISFCKRVQTASPRLRQIMEHTLNTSMLEFRTFSISYSPSSSSNSSSSIGSSTGLFSLFFCFLEESRSCSLSDSGEAARGMISD